MGFVKSGGRQAVDRYVIRVTGDTFRPKGDDNLRLKLAQCRLQLPDHHCFVGLGESAVLPAEETHIDQTEDVGGGVQLALADLRSLLPRQAGNACFTLRRADQGNLNPLRGILRQAAAQWKALVIWVSQHD